MVGSALAPTRAHRLCFIRLITRALLIWIRIEVEIIYRPVYNMAAVRASTRVSIAWGDQEAYEDTDTLVLTIHDFSLDLRVFILGPQRGQIDWSTVAKVSELDGSTKGG